MKKIFLLILSVSIVFVFANFDFIRTNPKPQKLRFLNKSLKTPLEDTYYWFSVKLTIKEEKKRVVYRISNPTRIVKGSLKQFEKAVWQGLAQRRVVVGAFMSLSEANNARSLYKPKKSQITKKPDIDGTIYWFALHFEESERLRILILRRKTGTVRSGTVDDFIDAFYQQLDFQMFTIGPFTSYEYAEEMKKLYRKNE